MKKQATIYTVLALAGGVLATSAAGCGGAATTAELRNARTALEDARSGPAARYKPDELRVAERALQCAEAAPDGTPEEADLAYVAQRRTELAVAEGRRAALQESVTRDRELYRERLEALARQRGEQIEQTERSLMMREQALAQTQEDLAQRDQAIAQTQQELEAERQARAEAEQRAEQAMTRLRELAAVRAEGNETIVTLSGEVLFESDRAELREGARDRLLPVADALRAAPDTVAVIEGHTDSRGSDQYNERLSQRRAEAVRDFLVGEGVPVARVQAVGRGESSPMGSNDTPEGRAENRRVEIRLRPMGTTPQSSPPTTPE